MSNATSPSAPKEVPRGETPPKPEYTGEAIEQDVFPFLVASQDSVTNGEPPVVDNAKLARQKRKRTSPEDQATLEAEYKKNPKPDKMARMSIVEQVSLGEKEVQIWFQNRRQNTRRKSRPLLPHEIAAFGINGSQSAPSSTPARQPPQFNSSFPSSQENLPPSASQTSNGRYKNSSDEENEPSRPSSSPQFKEPTTISLQTPAPSRSHVTNSETALPTFTPLKPSHCFADTYPYAPHFKTPGQPTQTPGYLANRWNMSSICGTPMSQKSNAAKFMTPRTGEKGEFMTPSQLEREANESGQTPSSCPLPLSFDRENLPTPASLPNPSTGNVRLSLSLEGRAELVSADMSSSPPRPILPARLNSALGSIRRTSGLTRSLSATAAVPFSLSRSNTPARTPLPTAAGVSSVRGVPKLPAGRSRDASAWQFCADADARDELTMLADNESNGSAVAAISLIRSSSGKALKTPLRANSNKRNAAGLGGKEQGSSGKKVKRSLGRAVTALGRLQNTGPHGGNGGNRQAERLVDPKKGGDGGESDKENWLPGELPSSVRRPLPGSATRQFAKTPSKAGQLEREKERRSLTASTPLTGRNRSKAGKQKETVVFEDGSGSSDGEEILEGEKAKEKETSEEVERFMRGDPASPGKKGDLDCIQGLLSLSQGAWR